MRSGIFGLVGWLLSDDTPTQRLDLIDANCSPEVPSESKGQPVAMLKFSFLPTALAQNERFAGSV
jgi:hypothetical protein